MWDCGVEKDPPLCWSSAPLSPPGPEELCALSTALRRVLALLFAWPSGSEGGLGRPGARRE